MGNFFRSFMGIITGLLILVLALLGIWAYDAIGQAIIDVATAAQDAAVPGSSQVLDISDGVRDVLRLFDYPGGRVLFPAMGIFFIVWAVALALKQSWARIAGIALYALAVVYLLILAVFALAFFETPFVVKYRWWMLLIWLLLLFVFGYQLISLIAGKQTERDFAAQFVGRSVANKCDRCGTALDRRGRCPKCEPAAEPVPGPAPGPDPKPPPPVPPPISLARLRGEAGEFHMTKSSLTIGRSSDNDVVLDEKSVSGHHAKITLQQGQFVIEDVGSTNGTIVNGSKIDKSRLEGGAKIQFGRVEFRFDVPRKA